MRVSRLPSPGDIQPQMLFGDTIVTESFDVQANPEDGTVEKIYYNDGRFKVTSTKFQSHRSTLRLAFIEQININRSMLGLAAIAPVVAVATVLNAYWFFYWYEIAALLGVSVGIGIAGWRVGAMQLVSRTTNERPYVWDYETLKKIREAVHLAIQERDENVLGVGEREEALQVEQQAQRRLESS